MRIVSFLSILCPGCVPVSVPFHPHYYYMSVKKSSSRAARSVRRNVPAVHSLLGVLGWILGTFGNEMTWFVRRSTSFPEL